MYPPRVPRSVVTRRKTAETTQGYINLWIMSGNTVHKFGFKKAPHRRNECFENHTEAKNCSTILTVHTAMLLSRWANSSHCEVRHFLCVSQITKLCSRRW